MWGYHPSTGWGEEIEMGVGAVFLCGSGSALMGWNICCKCHQRTSVEAGHEFAGNARARIGILFFPLLTYVLLRN